MLIPSSYQYAERCEQHFPQKTTTEKRYAYRFGRSAKSCLVHLRETRFSEMPRSRGESRSSSSAERIRRKDGLHPLKRIRTTPARKNAVKKRSPRRGPLSFFSYSVRRATTGSFFAATDEGTSPAMSVRQKLITTMSSAWRGLNEQRFNPFIFARLLMIRLIGSCRI